MAHWKVDLLAWPFSGVASATFPKLGVSGQEGDYKLSGPEKRSFEVEAEDMRGALRAADLIVLGIKSSGHVWEAPIQAITRKRD